MSTDDISAIHKRLDAQDATLSAIHVALVGSPGLGNPGLVKRLEGVESKQLDHDKTMLKWAGIATGLSIAATTFKDRIFGP